MHARAATTPLITSSPRPSVAWNLSPHWPLKALVCSPHSSTPPWLCAVLSVGTPKTYIHPENLLKCELWWSVLWLRCKGTVFMCSVLYSGHPMTSAHPTVLLGSGRLQGRGGFLIIEGGTDLLTFPTPCPSWAMCSCKYNVCPVGRLMSALTLPSVNMTSRDLSAH